MTTLRNIQPINDGFGSVSAAKTEATTAWAYAPPTCGTPTPDTLPIAFIAPEDKPGSGFIEITVGVTGKVAVELETGIIGGVGDGGVDILDVRLSDLQAGLGRSVS